MLTVAHATISITSKMTTAQTIKTLRKAGKPVSLTHLYRLFKDLRIKPLGRSRPQQYPDYAANLILTHLGFSSGGVARPSTARLGNLSPAPAGKLISVRTLRAAKHKHTTKGTK